MSKIKPLLTWRSAIAESDLPPGARLVAFTLSLHMSELGDQAFPSLERQASESGLARSTVATHLKRLEQSGWLQRTPGGGRGRSTTYRASVPETVRQENRPINDAKPSDEAQETVRPSDPNSKELTLQELSTSASPNGNGHSRPRNPFFDALVEVCGYDPKDLTKANKSHLGSVASQLREVGATPPLIRGFEDVWGVAHPDIPVTPGIVAKHWPEYMAGRLQPLRSRR